MRNKVRGLVFEPKKELEVMGILEWGAIVATIGLLITVGGLVWRLATRIGSVESTAVAASGRADIAGIQVAANALKVERVATELSKHREDTARDYVSYTHMVTLENRLVDAISQLGNRIDGLFSRVSHS